MSIYKTEHALSGMSGDISYANLISFQGKHLGGTIGIASASSGGMGTMVLVASSRSVLYAMSLYDETLSRVPLYQ